MQHHQRHLMVATSPVGITSSPETSGACLKFRDARASFHCTAEPEVCTCPGASRTCAGPHAGYTKAQAHKQPAPHFLLTSNIVTQLFRYSAAASVSGSWFKTHTQTTAYHDTDSIRVKRPAAVSSTPPPPCIGNRHGR